MILRVRALHSTLRDHGVSEQFHWACDVQIDHHRLEVSVLNVPFRVVKHRNKLQDGSETYSYNPNRCRILKRFSRSALQDLRLIFSVRNPQANYPANEQVYALLQEKGPLHPYQVVTRRLADPPWLNALPEHLNDHSFSFR